MTRKLPLFLSATALTLVLGAPAFAQTTILQNNGTSLTPSQIDINTAIVFSPGSLVTSLASQTAGTLYNAIGPTASVGISDPYTIDQAAGTYTSTNGPVVDNVISTSNNVIGAVNVGFPTLSDVVSGGNQSATNQVNLANVAPLAGSAGTLTQVVGAATLTATNSMFSGVQNGNAAVIGSNGADQPGFQQAVGSLNTAGVYLTPPTDPGDATDLTISQKLTANNSVAAANSAIANSVSSGSTILDPTVQNINQSSGVGVNQLSFASAGPATVGLDGSQNGVTPPAGEEEPGMLTAVVGNSAAAFTGAPSATYNLFSNASGNGSASVSGVTQNASFGLNNVYGDSNTSIALSNTLDPADGFLQTVDGTTQSVTGPTAPGGNVYPNVINGLAAQAAAGSASIVGTARTQSTDPFTQSFSNQQNSISTGGSLTGSATQTATNFNQAESLPGGIVEGYYAQPGYYNVAIANVNSGPASETNVSQSMTQSLNTVQAGAASNGLTLAQNADAVTLGSNNLQIAAGSSNATISGAQQLLNTSVNVAQLGAMSGSVTQTATSVNLANTNTLVAQSNFNASISGAQVANSSINVIK